MDSRITRLVRFGGTSQTGRLLHESGNEEQAEQADETHRLVHVDTSILRGENQQVNDEPTSE